MGLSDAGQRNYRPLAVRSGVDSRDVEKLGSLKQFSRPPCPGITLFRDARNSQEPGLRPTRCDLTITSFSVNLLENKELLCYINVILICQSFGVIINEQDPCLLLECPVCDMPFTTYLPGRGFRKNQCPCLGLHSDGLRGAGRLVFPLHGSRVSCSYRPLLSNLRPPASALSGATLCVSSTCEAHG